MNKGTKPTWLDIRKNMIMRPRFSGEVKIAQRANMKSVRGGLDTIITCSRPIRRAPLGKNLLSFSMRLTKKLLVEEGSFLYFSTLILPNAFKPERERIRYKSRYLAWRCVVRHFAILRQKKPVCVISCEQESVPSGERWFHLERNCSALCKRPSFRQEVSEMCTVSLNCL